MGQVSDNESFKLHMMAGAGGFDYLLHHHLGSANQDVEVAVPAQGLADLRGAARDCQNAFDAVLEDVAPCLYSVMGSGARQTLRSVLLHLDNLPGS